MKQCSGGDRLAILYLHMQVRRQQLLVALVGFADALLWLCNLCSLNTLGLGRWPLPRQNSAFPEFLRVAYVLPPPALCLAKNILGLTSWNVAKNSFATSVTTSLDGVRVWDGMSLSFLT